MEKEFVKAILQANGVQTISHVVNYLTFEIGKCIHNALHVAQ